MQVVPAAGVANSYTVVLKIHTNNFIDKFSFFVFQFFQNFCDAQNHHRFVSFAKIQEELTIQIRLQKHNGNEQQRKRRYVRET